MRELIGYPLGWIMWLFYQITHNYAWAIVFFTLVTKILLFPLSVKQQKSTAAMTAFQPKLEKLKKQYANNQQKLQEEQMKLYAEEGINPMSSCLPMFIQFPLLYGIFDVVYRPIYHILRTGKDAIEAATNIAREIFTKDGGTVPTYFEYRPEIYIIKELQKDPAAFSAMNEQYPDFVEKVSEFNNKLFGVVDLGDMPNLHPEVWNAAAVILLIIPIMSGLINLFQTIYMQIRSKKANPDAPDMAGMNIMFYAMPIFSVWIAFRYPAGIGFYWTVSALFGVVQSVILNKVFTPEYVASLVEKDKAKRKKKARPSMMERYQQLMEEQMAQQGGGAKPSQSKGGIALSSASDEEEDKPEVKLSKAKQKEYERMLIREARRRQAEKYGEEFIDDDE
ncbi:MAG: YidC/Oxa1 family membrane protein insertase [Ruminococcus sp.]|nr:YidC/Oxa1 family membrane protein insertase [Ruminococcus sp.]MCM1381486.1 YidC/Oxa1 family membrane protein insertase [Muribaculaceae bacterium]MCM1480579.1 YidC/Oxa1 family membrane protein insertase [Muribaculaceae bacterium]